MDKIHSHNNFFYFTASLILLLLISAFVSSTPTGEYHGLLQTVFFITEFVAYFSLSLSRKWRIFIGFMLVVMVTGSVLREYTDWSVTPIISLGGSLVFYCGMAYTAARQTLFTGDIEPNTIVGTLAVYLLLGLIWAMLYLIVLEFWPAAINGIEYKDWHENLSTSTYFSFVTMASLGYGDITPAIPITRTLAYLQAITGAFYMAVVVASLIGRVSKQPK